MTASERLTLEDAIELLPKYSSWMNTILDRIETIRPISKGMDVLEIGAAQGRGLAGLVERGLNAKGVEPWDEAREVAQKLAAHLDMDFDIRAGAAEDIPFEDASFDLVLATSVMEHVSDLEQSLREIYRVLRPGGVFWFNSASAMCPKQGEIRGFPAFGWYPDPIKKRIMRWAMDARPELVGHTRAPAYHWWTNRNAEKRLRAAGFEPVEMDTSEFLKSGGSVFCMKLMFW